MPIMRLPFIDSLTNLVANLGTSRDKAAHTSYGVGLLTDQQLMDMYRGAWLPRKIVDIPALDATRQWRQWQAEAKQIEAVEAEEKRLGLRVKVREALTKARLFGGSAIYIGTDDTDPSKPLNPQRLRRGGLRYLAVMQRKDLTPTELETDPMQPRYGMPKAYQISSGAAGMQTIHPSRLAVFIGSPFPDSTLATGPEYGWGDSVLLALLDALKNSDATMANVASMVFEAKIDVLKIPQFMDNVNDKQYRTRLLERLSLAGTAKSINGMLVLDAEEEYETKSLSFGNLPELMDRFLQAVSGAADIPVTRLLGQSPAGMSSTGESDTRNYYDRIRASQELDIAPALQVLDECLIQSALGTRPAEVHYQWASLWQTTPKERADIGKTVAETIVALENTKLWPADALAQAGTTMLVETGAAPGLESAMREYVKAGGDVPEPEEVDDETKTGDMQ